MKRLFKIMVCAFALFAFTNIAQAQQQGEGKRLLLNIVRKVKPEHVATLRDSFLKCRVETLKEKGCERYEIYQSSEDPTIFFIYEIWTTEQAHREHNATPHVKIHSEECRGINDLSFKGEFIRTFIE